MTTRAIRVASDEQSAAAAAAVAVAGVITSTTAARGRCAIALSGGSTPQGLYRVLASTYRTVIPWTDVHVFWGDERFVPAAHPDSNYGMARRTLLDHVSCPDGNIHQVPTNLRSPVDAAEAYAATLRAYFAGASPRFDLMLLGIGADGHTASLFPGAPALAIDHRTVAAITAPDGSERITLTLPVLLAARTTFIVATGVGKAEAIARALDSATRIADCPAAALRHSTGEVVWWLDRGAAEGLEGTEASTHGDHGGTEASDE